MRNGVASVEMHATSATRKQFWPLGGLTNLLREVLVLRATLNQRVHLFDAALTELPVVLEADPHDAQVLLLRATVFQMVGQFDNARGDCVAVDGVASELVSTTCLDNVNAMTGLPRESYDQLRAALETSQAQPNIKSWALTSLAEMAARAGLPKEAEADFRQALAIVSTDNYRLAAFSDFLLDQNRPVEVEGLLRSFTRNDPLLLRYALAL